MDILITGTVLGGTYALIALGLTLQYGVARIMNLANGENLVLACFCAFWLQAAAAINPLQSLLNLATTPTVKPCSTQKACTSTGLNLESSFNQQAGSRRASLSSVSFKGLMIIPIHGQT